MGVFSTNFRKWNFFLLNSFRSKPEDYEAETKFLFTTSDMGAHNCRVLGWMDHLSDPAWLGEIGLQHQEWVSACFTAWKAGPPSKALQSVETTLKSLLHFRGTAVPSDSLCICLEGRHPVYIQKNEGVSSHFCRLCCHATESSVLTACPAAPRAGRSWSPAGQVGGCERGTELAGVKCGNSHPRLTGEPHLFPCQMSPVLPVETGGKRELPFSLQTAWPVTSPAGACARTEQYMKVFGPRMEADVSQHVYCYWIRGCAAPLSNPAYPVMHLTPKDSALPQTLNKPCSSHINS